MQNSFANALLQFALAVDIVNTEILDHARKIVERYVKEALNVTYIELMRATTVGGGPGLETVWATAKKHSDPVKSPDDNYTNQICYVFGEGKPLWVVNRDKSPLNIGEDYVDLWSGQGSLPKYELSVDGQDFRTAIIIPLKPKEGGCLGVLDFESSEYMEITEDAKRELSILAEALCVLNVRHIMNVNDAADTEMALRKLEESLESKYLLKLSKPKLFFAWPNKAERSVVALIRTVLDDFSDGVNIITWDEIEESGDINDQIVEHILSSTYGVCYLSEVTDENSEVHYRDNANVLIEAGMLHVLSQESLGLFEAWLPIREDAQPPVPFDFISQRILFVPRLQSGELNEKLFQEQLRKRIEHLFT